MIVEDELFDVHDRKIAPQHLHIVLAFDHVDSHTCLHATMCQQDAHPSRGFRQSIWLALF